MNEQIKILIVDDEEEIREIVGSWLKKRGYDVSAAASAKEAIELIKTNNPQVMLLDKRMPDVTGIELLRQIRKSNPYIRVIMASADPLDDQMRKDIRNLGISAYIQKPFFISMLEVILKPHQPD